VHIAGQCKMCETSFDVTVKTVNGIRQGDDGDWFYDYQCPCGYFRVFEGQVSEDDHGTTQEEWKRRLKTAKKAKAAKKQAKAS